MEVTVHSSSLKPAPISSGQTQQQHSTLRGKQKTDLLMRLSARCTEIHLRASLMASQCLLWRTWMYNEIEEIWDKDKGECEKIWTCH